MISIESKELTLVQHKAIGALLTERTLAEAAAKTKVSRSTIYDWLKQDTFKRELTKQRQKMNDLAIQKIRDSVIEAVDVLVKLMKKEDSGYIQLLAARTIIDYNLKIKEIDDVEGRLKKIERVILERKTYE